MSGVSTSSVSPGSTRAVRRSSAGSRSTPSSSPNRSMLSRRFRPPANPTTRASALGRSCATTFLTRHRYPSPDWRQRGSAHGNHVPDYPARLEVEYPDSLSRGLVLVKWWLLALPHYLVIAVFVGGAWAGSGIDRLYGGGGLVGLLVLFAGIMLLFTSRYPKPLYDFVLGMNRWAFRVAAYATLMTDVYPPFRLDMGGDEPTAETSAGDVPLVPAPVTA